jgi:protein arginine kinase activator
MLCQDCKKREAQVHLTQIVNNEKLSLSLCKECAAARGFHSPLDNVPFPLAEILSGLVEPGSPMEKADPADDLACESCGLTFQEFTRQGRFGCGDCYSAFRTRIEPIMRKIHGASLHRGQNPEYAKVDDAAAMPIKEEERLEAELNKAIEDEDFERAAELRDKLKAVRDNLTVEEAPKG